MESPWSVLTALITVDTTTEAQLFVRYATAGEPARATPLTPLSVTHDLEVTHLLAERSYELELIALNVEGRELGREQLRFTTGPLPEAIPELTVEVFDAEAVCSGVTIFAPESTQGCDTASYYVGLDDQGRVVWYREGAPCNNTVRQLPDGTLLLARSRGGRGRMPGYGVYSPGGRLIAPIVLPELALDSHDLIPGRDGHYLGLVEGIQPVTVDWADRAIDALGIDVVEFDFNGNETWRWSPFDHLDPSATLPPEATRLDGALDWTHSNALVYDAEEEMIYLSIPTLGWIVKIDREDGQIEWRFGEGGDFEMQSHGPNFFHAHELQGDGSVLMFDVNRALRYSLDESEMSAELVWKAPLDYSAGAGGDADLLSNGNVLTGGGRSDKGATLFELTGGDEPRLVWTLDVADRRIYRAIRVESIYGP